MDCPLKTVVNAFAEGLHAIDSSGIPFRAFQPGVGPYGEAEAVRRALQHMREHDADQFSEVRDKQRSDILIPEKWALEVKIIRPFGDNGRPAEHWSENILHPYPGNVSSLGD